MPSWVWLATMACQVSHVGWDYSVKLLSVATSIHKRNLKCWRKKRSNQTKGSQGQSLAKTKGRGAAWFSESCCVWAETVRREGGAAEKGNIQKGLVSHTEQFACYPSGNQMQSKAFKRDHSTIRFASWKDFPGSSRKEDSERGWLLLDQGSLLESSCHHPGKKLWGWEPRQGLLPVWNMGDIELLKDI